MKRPFQRVGASFFVGLTLICDPVAAKPKPSASQIARLVENAFGSIWIDSDAEDADIEFDVRAALDAGASPNTRNEYGETLLLQAIENLRIGSIEILLKRSANPNLAVINDKSAQPLGETPLMRTVSMDDSMFHNTTQRLQIMGLLIKHGAKLNQRDKAGNTALTLAAINGQSEAAKLLLKHCADFRLRNLNGQTALQMASIPVARGSSSVIYGFSNLEEFKTQEARLGALNKRQKQSELLERRLEARLSKGRAAVAQHLKAAGAKQ